MEIFEEGISLDENFQVGNSPDGNLLEMGIYREKNYQGRFFSK